MEISRDQYLQALGLLTLAHKHADVTNQCAEALAAIVEPGIETTSGHSYDAVWGNYTLEELLKKIDVTVAKNPKKR